VKKISAVIVLVIVSLCCHVDVAGAGDMKAEIEHLMNYIKNSGCTFMRNDKKHSPTEAVDHIMRKYAYFKEDIKKTEDFIELCASRSTVSKKPYYVICGSKERVKTGDWLVDELTRYRAK
jgi:hypothetical protein